MNCDKCKTSHATFHLTAIEANVKKEVHLCEECAQKAGMGIGSKFNFSVADVLGSLIETKVPRAGQTSCPECGITYSEFKTKARLGCARDYEIFHSELVRLLEKIHGSTTHVGKMPRTADAHLRKESELLRLKRDLDSVVKTEDFEKAAQLRDRIKSIETELNP